jgi:hypothetical protein
VVGTALATLARLERQGSPLGLQPLCACLGRPLGVGSVAKVAPGAAVAAALVPYTTHRRIVAVGTLRGVLTCRVRRFYIYLGDKYIIPELGLYR